jgi:hypothetical protein
VLINRQWAIENRQFARSGPLGADRQRHCGNYESWTRGGDGF